MSFDDRPPTSSGDRSRLKEILNTQGAQACIMAGLAVVMASLVGPSRFFVIVLAIVAAVVATIYPIVYAFTSRGLWMRSTTGITLMAHGIIIASMLDLTLLGRTRFVHPEVLLFLAIVLYTGLILVKLSLIRTALRLRVKKRKRGLLMMELSQEEKLEVQTALARETQDGPGFTSEEDLPPEDFAGYTDDDVEKDA